MFTGLVEEIGVVEQADRLPDAARLRIRAPRIVADAAPGDSISVAGCCLTVAGPPADDGFAADVMTETLRRTTLGGLAAGSRVNVERAVTATTRLGGHLVQGHVDGTSTLIDRRAGEHSDVLRFALPAPLARYVVPQGSITVDGVSLTVVELADDRPSWFSVSLIPTTLAETTLGALREGEPVNLEVDVLAKYVERLTTVRDAPGGDRHE